jgi:deoxyribodipyrimidine photo-lyase
VSTGVAIVLFTRDLRVDDNPTLSEAVARSAMVVPLFVHDARLRARCDARTGLLDRYLADLDDDLRSRGGRLIEREGDAVTEVARVAAQVGASAVYVARDHTEHARRRLEHLQRALPRAAIREVDSITVVPAGRITPAGRDAYRIFTPYYNAWRRTPWRDITPTPGRITLPPALANEERRASPSGPRPDRPGPGLKFGRLSALRIARETDDEELRRKLAWRDFFAQLLDADPGLQHRDLLVSDRTWADDPALLDAWREGRTGVPIVDAGMRQLAEEGHISNRLRMIVASFLTKDLNVDWRAGAAHFDRLLLDGDHASNVGNWQWVAGTGTDPRRGRLLSPRRQQQRFDPSGAYVARWIPELGTPSYPPPVVDLDDSARRYRERTARLSFRR